MCCKLKLSDIHDIGKDKWGWECLTCTTEMFPFTTVEDRKLQKWLYFKLSLQMPSNFKF